MAAFSEDASTITRLSVLIPARFIAHVNSQLKPKTNRERSYDSFGQFQTLRLGFHMETLTSMIHFTLKRRNM